MGTTLVWEKGRQLKQFGTNTYTYNNEGIRTSKTVGGVKHTYVLDGTNIVKETWGSNTLIPLYDLDGTVCGINYNGTAYYFYKNLQGDVVAITNDAGVTVAKYSYDAWGQCSIASDTSGVNIATINPFRYRSYYYDTEIGMYYLQSRYYDANIGRFINTDDENIVISKLSFCHNSFSFCENNAIDNYDFYGFISIKAMAMLVCAIAGAVYAVCVVDKRINKKYFEEKHIIVTGLMIYLAAFIGGGICGLIAGSKITGSFQLVLGVIGAIIAVVSYLGLNSMILKSEIKSSDVLWVAIKGFAAAAIGVGKKTGKTEIIKLVFKACGLGALCGVADLFLF